VVVLLDSDLTMTQVCPAQPFGLPLRPKMVLKWTVKD